MNRGNILVAALAIAFLIMPLLTALMVSPFGGTASFACWCFIMPTCAFVGFMAFVMALCAIPAMFFKKMRTAALKVEVAAILLGVALIGGNLVSHAIRHEAFRQLAYRSRPLTEAILAFEHKHGKPPDKLERVIPEFLSNIPNTGMSAYPAYKYDCPSKDKDSLWELNVQCSSGILNWDVFFFWPSKKYPREIYGGHTEAIGDWAYVHE